MPKTWIERLETEKKHKICVLEHAFGGIPAGKRMLVATPKIVAEEMQKIPTKNSLSRSEFRTVIAKRYKAYGSCPLSTAIFIRIVAEAMYEKHLQGVDNQNLVPFWRVTDTKGEKKYSFPIEFLESLRKDEGIEL